MCLGVFVWLLAYHVSVCTMVGDLLLCAILDADVCCGCYLSQI